MQRSEKGDVMRGLFLKRFLALASGLPLVFAVSALSPGTPSARATTPDASGRIAFSRVSPTVAGCCDIYTIEPDGTGIQRLTYGGTGDFPAWSPSGRRIAYSAPDPRKGIAIWVMNADGSGARPLTHPGAGFDQHAAWSPDGERIAFDRTTHGSSWVDIWIMNADGTGATRVHRSGMQVSWAPDGKRISFEGFSFSEADLGIWVMNLKSGSLRHIVSGSTGSEDPSWSPNGKLIAFSRGHQDGAGLGPAGIWVVRPDGSGLRGIARGRYWEPAWSPDGSRIAFSSGRSGFEKIWTIGANGDQPRQVTWLANAPDLNSTWQPVRPR